MKKLFTFGIWIVLLFVVASSTAQRRYFYSLKYVKVGQNNVRPPYSAGMYVTFPASKDGKYICYDSDRNGYAVNASFKLDYIGNNQKAYSYYGWTYWGQAYYNFSRNYSLLNVVDEIGNTYVFYRTNGTQPNSTYYSVTDSHTDNSGGTGSTVIVSGSPNSSGTSSPGGKTKRTVRVKCQFCNGTGISWSEKVYLPNYTGSDERQWCSRCNAWGIPHKHIDHRCTVCRNGYIEKEE